MDNLNSILIEGNLVRDPEVKIISTKTALCQFSIAVNKSFKKNDEWQKEVSYFDITTWAKLAERCGEQLKKGRGVRVCGRLKQDRWMDQEGKQHSKVCIIAEHVEFKPVYKDNQQGQAPDPAPEANNQAADYDDWDMPF
jgi:single-strand DNA-binding protein